MDKSLTETPIPSLQELKVNFASLLKKQETLEKYDVEILQLVTDEEEVEKEVDESCIYADRIIEAKTKVESSIDIYITKSKVVSTPENAVESKLFIKTESQIKLPKISLKIYDGSLFTWNNFRSQFEAAIHINRDISEIQMFTYLKSFSTGEAESAIQRLTLVKENFQTAVDALNSRFGNKQSRISAHMKELRTLKTVSNINDVTSLRNMFGNLK